MSRTLQQILLVTACLTAFAAGDAATAEQSGANTSVTSSTSETEKLQEVFVTAQPKPLLRAMFGNATLSKVDAFIDMPRAVKVWHNTHIVPAGAMEIAGSRNSKFVHAFGLVYVFVDRTQLDGVSQEQFADYVAMVSLAEIKSTAHLGDARSILKVFDGSPQAAPQGLSDWDQEFLKILYHPEPSLANPRANIARRMVVELVP